MEDCKIHALHGFLGSPQDWSFLDLAKTERFFAYHLFKDFPILPFANWAYEFNKAVASNTFSNHLLMGYSLGGRLGLHALLQNPKAWKGAVFVSTHPGLKSMKEKDLRITADQQWAQRFEKEPWDHLMEAWNAQKVFKGGRFVFKCEESKFYRQLLSSALNMWSLGNQNDLSEDLISLDLPILWIVGAEDTKFHEIAKKLIFKNPQSRICVIPQAGHRVPWDQPDTYKLNVIEFIRNLKEQKND